MGLATARITLSNGAIPMQDMDLVVLPLERHVAVNPPHPDFAAGRVK